jgi:DNA-binding MarR family transcriptional regulator
MTFIIDGLESSGLVIRSRNPADRRAIFVELTEDGRKLARQFVGVMPSFFSSLTRDLTARDKQTLNRLLKKLQRGMASKHAYEA